MTDLTIMMLVKGRDLHTLRWMWHANKAGLAYPVIIGDGGDNPISRRVLADRSLFPNLDYQYLQYNDASYEDYFRKAADVCRRVETKYVFRCDNDDFILPSGLERAVQFLRDNPDFIWSGAPLLQFSVHGGDHPTPHLLGDLYRLHMDRGLDVYQDGDPLARMRAFAQSYRLQVYYAVGTRERMLHTLEKQLALNPRNFDVNDVYTTFLSLFLGKHKVDTGSLIYLHQTHTSQIHSTLADFPHRLYHNDFMGDFNRMYADLAAHGDVVQAQEIYGLVRDFYARMLRTGLQDGSDRHAPSGIRRWLKTTALARQVRLAKDMKTVVRRLQADGAQPQHLAAVSADIEAVRQTLAGDDFRQFLHRVAPELNA